MATDPYGPSDQSVAWGTIVAVLLIIIVVLLIGYFAWYAPAHREDTTIIQTPGNDRIVPVPTPAPSPAPQQPAPSPERSEGPSGDVNVNVNPGQ